MSKIVKIIYRKILIIKRIHVPLKKETNYNFFIR